MLTQAYVDCIKQTIQAGWVQHHFAVTADGWTVLPNNDRAVKFCVLGAAIRCCPDTDTPQYNGEEFRGVIREFIDEFFRAHNTYVSSYNDQPFRTVEQMIEALDALPVEVS